MSTLRTNKILSLDGEGEVSVTYPYTAGRVIESHNDIIRDGAAEWKLSESIALPYTTTGAGLPEGGAFVSVGDAVLRQELANPDMGAAMVGYEGGTVDEELDRNKLISSTGGSFVDKLTAGIRPRGMYIRKIDANKFDVGYGLTESLQSVVEFRFRKDADKLLLLRGVLSGVEETSGGVGVLATLDGTYNEWSAPETFTTTIGDKWSAEFTGQSCWFRHRVDNRGGIWELTLQPLGIKRQVTCYSDVTQIVTEELVFSGLPYGKYRVDAEFLGADPLNPPAEGVPPRGYLNYRAGENPLTTIRTGIVRPMDLTTGKWVISPNSIPDFAISARSNGAAYDHEWVPAHGSNVGQATEIEVRLLIDGVPVIDFDVDAELPVDYEFREIKTFELVQRFNARNSSGHTDGPLWEHTVRHVMSADSPVVTIQNRMELRQETSIATAYFGMLPAETSSVSRLALNSGQEIEPLPEDDSNSYFAENVSSAMFAGEFKPGNYHAAACSVNIGEALSYGRKYQPDVLGRINWRTDNVSKVYWTAARNTIMDVGDVLSAEQKIAVVSGVRAPNYDLRAI